MKKLWLSIAAVIVLIIGGLFVYAATIDWNQHKDKIAEQFALVTGKMIVFDGPVSFSLLPTPYLNAENVKIYNPGTQGGKPLATIKSLVATLSLRPLLKGNFDVKRMSLVNPEINLEVTEEGVLNWYSPLPGSQKDFNESEVQLDSVTLENASVDFVYPERDINVHLDSLNAEVMAQSILGPYHIEGSYVKDNNPEGFAISIGKISDSMPTTLNMVLNHPLSETIVRFDGTVLYKNRAVSGNFIFDSKKLMSFSEATFKQFAFDKNYDYPLAVSTEVNTNKTKIELNNLVVKYGTTAGAGNVLIPLRPDNPNLNVEQVWRPKIETGFEMTEWNLAPAVYWLQKQFDKYNNPEAVYLPEWDFDLAADIKAVKASYNNQELRDIVLSIDEVDNVLTLSNFNAQLPGDTNLSLSGSIFDRDERLAYSSNISFSANDFSKLLEWAGYQPEAPVPGVYRKAMGSIKFDGDMQRMQISPIEVTIDKTTFRGDVGVINGERLNMLAIMRADTVNFDNYVKPLPEEEQKKPFAERMAYRFGQLDFLNKFDMEMMLDLNLGIYEGMPFERTYLEGKLSGGRLNINTLDIASVANAQIGLSGEVSGFGQAPQFKNLKYLLTTADSGALVSKFGLNAPKLDLQKLRNLKLEGIASGNLQYFATKTAAQAGKISLIYGGEIKAQNGGNYYKGSVELRSPDFIELLNNLGFNYTPKVLSLGLFNLRGTVSGTADKLRLRNLTMNAGLNNFKGGIDYTLNNGRPKIAVEGEINKLEIDRFFYNGMGGKPGGDQNMFRSSGGNAEFLSQPFFSREKIDYSLFAGFDLLADLKFGTLSYGDEVLYNAAAFINLEQGTANIQKLNGTYLGGMLDSKLRLETSGSSKLSAQLMISNQEIKENRWSGKIYGLTAGRLQSSFNLETSAASVADMAQGLNGSVDFEITQPQVKGWDMQKIYDDVTVREKPDGLAALVKSLLSSGETGFEKLNGRLNFAAGKYTLADVQLTAPNLQIGISGQGNLFEWNTESSFAVKFPQPAYLPGFSFSLSGSLANPVLEVDIEDLQKMYHDRQDEFKAMAKAREEQRLNELRTQMQAQQNLAKTSKSEIINVIAVDLENKKTAAFNQETAAEYENLASEMQRINGEIEDIFAMGLLPDFTPEQITEVTSRNKQISQDIAKLQQRIRESFVKELRLRIKTHGDKIAQAYNNSLDIVENFRDGYSRYDERLRQAESGYQTAQDENILRMLKVIESRSADMENAKQQIDRELEAAAESDNANELEDKAHNLELAVMQIQMNAAALEQTVGELRQYAEERVALEEKKYHDRIKAEEIKRKLEENTGKISIKGTGKSMTVRRDIEDIEKAEEAQKNEEVKVLDFSAGNPAPQGIVRRSDSGAEKAKPAAGNLILREGEIKTKASGVIRKK